MEFFELVKSRRSVRKYTSKPVRDEDIIKILDSANWAPSALNRQQWEFIVVKGSWVERLGESFRTVVEGYAVPENEELASVVPLDEFIKFSASYGNAPVLIVVLTDRTDDPVFAKANIESASAAMQNLVLAAADIGLGTCWMTGPLFDEQNLLKFLGVPEDKEIVAITPLGWPEVIPKPLPRKDPDLIKKIRWLK